MCDKNLIFFFSTLPLLLFFVCCCVAPRHVRVLPLTRAPLLFLRLSRLAMLFQVHSLVSTKGKVNPEYASSLTEAAYKVMQREGFRAFWKGNGTSVLHRFPYSSINFYTYEKAYSLLGADAEGSSNFATATRRFLAGATAGTTAVIACYPLDLIRTRLTTQQPQTKYAYTGILDAFERIVRYEGPRGLYSGLGTTLCVAVPSFSISYCVYGSLKEYVLDDEVSLYFLLVSKTPGRQSCMN